MSEPRTNGTWRWRLVRSWADDEVHVVRRLAHRPQHALTLNITVWTLAKVHLFHAPPPSLSRIGHREAPTLLTSAMI